MRRVFIGPFQQGRISYCARTVGLPNGSLSDRYIGVVPTIVYASLLQAGADRIEVSSGFDISDPLPPSLQNRVEIVGIDEWAVANDRARAPFLSINPVNFTMEAMIILQLITELFHALDTGCHVAWMDIFPSAQFCDRFLPSRLAIPIGNLLSTVEVVEPLVVMPRAALFRKDVALLDELLSDQAYQDYVGAHALLEDPSVRLADAVAAISHSAQRVAVTNTVLLRHEKAVTRILEIGAKLSSLLGTLAQVAGNAVADSLKEALAERRRLIIYDARTILLRIMARQSPEGVEA